MAVSYAAVWYWTKRIFRFYLLFTLIVWLISSCVLFYLMHTAQQPPFPPPPLSPTSPTSPTSPNPPPLSGPHRVHAALHSSVDHLHARFTTLFTQTRRFTTDLLDHLDRTLHPSTDRRGGSGGSPGRAEQGVVGQMRRGVGQVVDVLQALMDGFFDGVRLGIDEWLAATLDMIHGMREQQQQQPEDWRQRMTGDRGGLNSKPTAQGGVPTSSSASTPSSASGPSGSASGAAASPSGAAALQQAAFRATPPLTSLVRRPLADGSVLYLSPEASSSEQFSLDVVAGDDAGKAGERRVALSVKDGLLRVTRKGGGSDHDNIATAA